MGRSVGFYDRIELAENRFGVDSRAIEKVDLESATSVHDSGSSVAGRFAMAVAGRIGATFLGQEGL